jgi:6-phosphogluconate dehydrogenase
MIGLGTMGCNLLLNIADYGFSTAGYDKGDDEVSTLNQLGHAQVKGFADIIFIHSLEGPRA